VFVLGTAFHESIRLIETPPSLDVACRALLSAGKSVLVSLDHLLKEKNS